MLLTVNAPTKTLRLGKKKEETKETKALLCYPKAKDIHTREIVQRSMYDVGTLHVMGKTHQNDNAVHKRRTQTLKNLEVNIRSIDLLTYKIIRALLKCNHLYSLY